MRVPQRRGEDLLAEVDEHIRPDTSMESLARLRPILGAGDPEATVTAGNASGRTTRPPSSSSLIVRLRPRRA